MIDLSKFKFSSHFNTVTQEGDLLRINGALLTHSQVCEFEKLVNRVDGDISKLDDQIKAIEAIRYVPKKDGTERANFVTNFEFDGLGATYGGCNGPHRYVTIRFVRSFFGSIYSIGISTAYVEGKFNETEQSVDVSKFNPKYDGKKEMPAKDVFETISGPYLNYLRETRQKYQDELRMLPQLFQDYIISTANQMVRAKRNVQEFTHVFSTLLELVGYRAGDFADNE